MGSKERILKKKADVSDSIIRAAMDILESEGIDGISMRKIASRIEYSPPVIYACFQNKDALTDRLISIGFGKLLRQVSGNVPDSAHPLLQLEYMFFNYIEFALENKPLYLLMSRRMIEKPAGNKTESLAEEFAAFFKTEIQRLVPVKKNPVEVEHMYYGMLSLVHGIISVCYVSQEYAVKERSLAVRIMIEGFVSYRK